MKAIKWETIREQCYRKISQSVGESGKYKIAVALMESLDGRLAPDSLSVGLYHILADKLMKRFRCDTT